MRRVDYGDGDGGDLVALVLGWGNRPEHDGVQWLIEQFTAAGYRVSAFELPRTITDFGAEYLAPVESFLADREEYRLLSHSTGGLICRHLPDDGPATRTYLSPWWGFPGEGLSVVDVAAKLPISTPILPTDPTRSDLGELASEEWLADAPDYAAPTFLREAKRAQASLPPFDDDDVVFYAPDDAVVDPGAIESQAPAANRVRYEGGHELFCSRARDRHVDALLSAVDGGVDALPA
ncbi:MAG: alpha/beta hydrolase [Halolamina sp.]